MYFECSLRERVESFAHFSFVKGGTRLVRPFEFIRRSRKNNANHEQFVVRHVVSTSSIRSPVDVVNNEHANQTGEPNKRTNHE